MYSVYTLYRKQGIPGNINYIYFFMFTNIFCSLFKNVENYYFKEYKAVKQFKLYSYRRLTLKLKFTFHPYVNTFVNKMVFNQKINKKNSNIAQ